MGGWGNATRQGTTGEGTWNCSDWTSVRRERVPRTARAPGRWTALDVALAVATFLVSHELCLAFIALKLWHQASGYEGSVLAFAADRWEMLVGAARRLFSGRSVAMPFVSRSSGNHAFDAWRESELSRIEAERAKLRGAEREFAAYRDELLHAKDREDFDRFMRARDGGAA